MKKILSVFLVAGILVACDDSKKEEKTTTTTETTETKTDGKDAADTKVTTETTTKTSVEVPKFADAEVQKMAEEYAAFIAEGTTLGTDPAKMEAYAKKSAEWGTKTQGAMTKLASSPDELKKWNDFMMNVSKAQAAKMTK